MSIFKKISIFSMLCLMCILFLAPVNAMAATKGQSLTSPETGWRRFDDKDINFYYQGSWYPLDNGDTASFYRGEIKYTIAGSTGDTVKFKFSGTKLRIIQQIYKTRSEKIQVKIDDKVVGYYSLYSPTLSTSQCLDYEITGLTNTVHYVELSNLDTLKAFEFDAIDIDSTGTLLPYDKVENLQAAAGDNKITLSWDPVPNATKYNVKRSAISGNETYLSSETIVSGSAISFIDTNVTPGTTYYYVVSAVVSGTEGPNSIEVSATPTEETTPPDHAGNTATLELTMTNGGIKVYNVPITDLDNFLTWYDDRSNGEGRAYYTFTKTTSIAPYLSVKEYVSFDKISSFEVKEYNQ